MSYKAKFSASEQKAHNRFIATKIHKEMAELRAGVEASPTTPKRWVWELIQNAKDVNIGGKVRVRIEADLDDPDAHLTFKHNGGAFSAENIRFLIEQVSSKDRTNDSDRSANDHREVRHRISHHPPVVRTRLRSRASLRDRASHRGSSSCRSIAAAASWKTIIEAVQAAKDSIAGLG